MLEAPAGLPDWIRLVICGGLALAGAVAMPLALARFFRRAGRRPTQSAWALCIGACAACVLAAFAADLLIAKSDESHRREFADRTGLVRTSQGATSDEYESPPGWSAAVPATPGATGGRATYMRMSVQKASLAEPQTLVIAEAGAALVAALLFFVLTRRPATANPA